MMTDEEIQKLLATNNMGKSLFGQGKFRDTGRESSGYGEALDSILGAPARLGLSELQKGNFNVQTLGSVLSQIGKDPQVAPTGYDIASRVTDNPYLGAALATVIDVGAQIPVPGFNPGFAAGIEDASAATKALLKKINTPEKAAALTGAKRAKYLDALEEAFGSKDARAKDLGFDLSKSQFHGSDQNIESFNPSSRGTFGPGVYTTDNKKAASVYASRHEAPGANVMELVTKPQSEYFDASAPSSSIEELPAFKDLGTAEKYDVRYDHETRAKFLKDQGYSGVTETKGREKYRNTFDPSDIRSVNAAFDPRFKDSANLMAGHAGPMPLPINTTPNQEEPQGYAKGGVVSAGQSFDQLPDDSQRAPQSTSPVGSFDSMVDDEDKFGGTTGEIKAGLAGAARGATFGLSDQALTKSGLVNPETLKGLQETNPISSFTGEMAGMIAPAFLGDEAGLANLPGAVSRLGRVAEGSAGLVGAGKVAAKAIGYGTEGAAYGLGQSVSENALGDHDLVSEKTLANIGLSAAFMGGIGGLVGKFGKGAVDASSGEDKFLIKKIESSAMPGSDEHLISQTDLPAEAKLSFIERFKSQRPDANGLRKEFSSMGLPEVLGMMSDNQTIRKFASAVAQLPTMAGDAVRKTVDMGYGIVNSALKDAFNVVPAEFMDRAAGGASIKDLILNKINEISNPLKERYAARFEAGQHISLPDDEVLSGFDDIISIGKDHGVTSDARKAVSEIADNFVTEASQKAGEGGRSAIANLDSFSKTLREKATKAFRSGDTTVGKVYSEAREKIENFMEDQLLKAEKEAEAAGLGTEGEMSADDMISEYRDLKSNYAKFKKTLSSFAQTTGLGKRANTSKSVAEVLSKIPDEQFVDHIFDPKNAAGLKDIQTNFPEVFNALVAQKKSQMYQNALTKNKNFNPLMLLKDLNNEQKISKGVKNLLFTPEQLQKLETSQKWLEALPDKVGPSGTPEGVEYLDMAKNPIKSLIGHSANEAGSAISKKLIESLTKPEEAAQLKTLLNLNKAQEKIDRGITTKVKSILGDSYRPVTAKLVSKIVSMADFNDVADRIREDASNPGKTVEKISSQTGDIYPHAPNVSDAMKMAFIRGTQFLNSKLPIQQPGVFEDKPEVSQSQISQFSRYHDIVENPLHALHQVENHTIVPETVEALNAVYPQLYKQMSLEIMHQIASTKDKSKIPFKTRQSISMLLGEPLDKSLNPMAIQANQLAFAQAPQPGQPMGGLKKTGDKLTLGKRTGINHGQMES